MKNLNTEKKEIGAIYYIELRELWACSYSNDSNFYFRYKCFPHNEGAITLVKYMGDNMYEELYTGLTLPLLLPERRRYGIILCKDQFEERYGEYKNRVDFSQKFEELVHNPLHITGVHEINKNIKILIGAQMDIADKLQTQISEIYKTTQETLKIDCQSKLVNCSDLNLAYGENVLFNFQKGINRKLKKNYTKE